MKNKNWDYITLDNVVDKGSSNISLNKVKDEEGDYPLYSAKGFYKNISFYHQEKEYIAIIKDGAGIGRLSVHPANSSVVGTMQYLIPKDGFDIMFIRYFLQGINFNQYKQGATIPHIYFKDYKSELVPNISIIEQKRIVAEIDRLFAKIDKAIALTEESLKQAENLLPAVLKQVFYNEKNKSKEVSLSSVVDIFSGVSLPSIFKGISEKKGDIPFYKVAQMNNHNKIMKDALLNFTNSESEEFKIKIFPKGTVLIPKRGGAILTNKKRILVEDASYDSNTMGLKAKNKFISDDYLFVVLNNIDLSKYIDESTIPQINNKHIDRMSIFLVDQDAQSNIVKLSNNITTKSTKLKSKFKKQLKNLRNLKSSLLSKAFSGEL